MPSLHGCEIELDCKRVVVRDAVPFAPVASPPNESAHGNGRSEHGNGRMSGLAVTGFVLSLLGIPFPVSGSTLPIVLTLVWFGTNIALALTFCFLGLWQIGRGTRQRGRGLARAGIAIAVVSVALAVAFALTAR